MEKVPLHDCLRDPKNGRSVRGMKNAKQRLAERDSPESQTMAGLLQNYIAQCEAAKELAASKLTTMSQESLDRLLHCIEEAAVELPYEIKVKLVERRAHYLVAEKKHMELLVVMNPFGVAATWSTQEPSLMSTSAPILQVLKTFEDVLWRVVLQPCCQLGQQGAVFMEVVCQTWVASLDAVDPLSLEESEAAMTRSEALSVMQCFLAILSEDVDPKYEASKPNICSKQLMEIMFCSMAQLL
eukprot:5640446-Amphidinium_carterae.3